MTLIPPPKLSVSLATCSVRAFRPDMGVPVRTTVGMIRRLHCAAFVSGLAPYGLLKVEDHGEFTRRYWSRLDDNAAKVDAQLAAAAASFPGQTLVLLCFEDVHKPGEWCHRTIAARWLSERYGCEVPELSGRPTPGAVTDPSLFDHDAPPAPRSQEGADHEGRARAKKATKLAAGCRASGITAEVAETLDNASRDALARSSGCHSPSDATWSLVVDLLREPVSA